jgi:hypothetical protein
MLYLPAGAPTPEEVVREFWRRMASNDFESVRAVLVDDDFVLEWPQSAERIRGSANMEAARHVPKHPHPVQLRATGDRARDPRCVAVVRAQAERHERALARQRGGL